MALEDLLEQRFGDLLSGKLKAHELPEFQSMREMLEKVGARSRAGTARQMRQMGISGPSVGLTMQKQEEGQLAPLGPAMGGYLATIPGRAAQWGTAQRGLDIQEKLGMGQLYEQRKARKFAEKQAKMAAWEGGFDRTMNTMCVLTTACYGPDSVEVAAMREIRDWAGDHPVAKKIIRGYYIFSDLLLPLMKFKLIKEAVRRGLVDSLMYALIRKMGFGLKTWRMPFDSAVSYIVLNFWRILGSRGPYRRRNGEVV